MLSFDAVRLRRWVLPSASKTACNLPLGISPFLSTVVVPCKLCFVSGLWLQEGEALLEGKQLQKTRAKTADRKTKEAEKTPRTKRTNTIAQTTQVRQCF